MVKVGDGTSPAWPSAARIARASVVLPAPRPPDSATTSPGRSLAAMRAPNASHRGKIRARSMRHGSDDRGGGARALLGLHVEPPAMRLDQLAGERQAQAAASSPSLAVGADAIAVERARQFARLHARAVVRNDDPRALLARATARPGCARPRARRRWRCRADCRARGRAGACRPCTVPALLSPRRSSVRLLAPRSRPRVRARRW